MNSISLSITVLLCLLILVLPRKWFLLPYIIAACMIPMDQRIIIGGMDFTALRFCVLVGFLRVLARGEIHLKRLNKVDILVFSWLICGSIIYILQRPEMSVVINRAGFLFDGLGLYWLFRQAVRRWEDLVRVIRFFAVLALLSAPLILIERIQRSSPYEILGHSPASMHRGRFRCSGPFPHYIMMGLFWASLLPWFYSCTRAGLSKFFYWSSMAAAFLCVFLSGSSTPLLTTVVIAGFLVFYRFRRYGRYVTLAVICMLVFLHFSMEAPVWHLLARVNLFSGSTGWHRYHLFDQFVRHTSEWFLLGTVDTQHWGSGLGDVTNQYVLEAVRGGFLTLLLFIILNVVCVAVPGKASIRFKSPGKSWLCWGVCVSVLAHNTSFWGVSYFGQMTMQLYLVFAFVAFIFDQDRLAKRSLKK